MENTVSVEGFPQGLNELKIKLFIERRVGKGLVESMTKEDDLIMIQFQNSEALQRFHGAKIKSIEFGGSVHNLTILKQDNAKKGSVQQSEPHLSSLPLHKGTDDGDNVKTGCEKKETNLLEYISQENLYSNVYHWCDLPTLPAPEKTKCVLAQNVNPTNHIQTVIMHFQLKNRSNGGPVKCLVQVVDGLLVIFDNDEDCESCSNMTDQTLGKDKLSIFSKIIPEYYKNKFVLKGVKETTAKDTVEMFLEACSKHETTPSFCEPQATNGVYLIEYREDFDGSETEHLLRKISSTPLEGNKLTATSLLKTDCLKVTGVTPDISNDAIHLVFINSKRTNGGPVTRVDRLKNESALVYFASYLDAEKVYKKFANPSSEELTIRSHLVKVELYYHALANDHTENIIRNFQQTVTINQQPALQAKLDLKPIFLTPPTAASKTILSFVFSSRTHIEKCKTAFKDVAKLRIASHQDFQIELTPNKDAIVKFGEQFTKHCEDILIKFLSGYTTVPLTFERSKLQRARSFGLYPEIEQIYRRNPNSEDVVICWKSGEPVVEITGLKSAVDEMIVKIENRVNSVVVTTPSNKNQFRILVSCGIVDELRKQHPDVSIKCVEEQYSLVITGLESEVHNVQLASLTLLNDVDKRVITDLDESIITFISKFLYDKSDLEVKLHQKFKSGLVKGVIMLDGDKLYLRVKTITEYNKAMDIIKQFLTVEEMKTDEADCQVLKSLLWRNFVQNLQKGMYDIKITANNAILMTGSREELKLLRVKIKKLLDENAIRLITVPMAYGFARFIVEYSEEFSKQACKTKQIECGLTPENGGGVFFKGKKNALDDAVSSSQELRDNIHEVMQSFNDPGVQKYYKSEQGSQFIKMIEKLNKCVILMSRECDEWVKYNKKYQKTRPTQISSSVGSTSVDLQESKLGVSMFSSVELSVWKTNIIKHKCDVIVNASNPELTLLGGLSGAIRELDVKNGNKIQKEMHSIIQQNYGNILPGDAAITSAGNLPACKKIVHAVGPRWDSSGKGDPKLILKACVSKSLELVDQAGLKSVAIPAISCGVFGGSVSVCIPLICEAVFDYLKEEHNSRIKKIHFVEKDRKDVLDALMKFLNAKSEGVQQSKHKVQLSSFPVHLHQGDIVSYQADVIVNATTPQSLTNMSNGPVVSKALAAKAGPSVQQQCSQIPPPHNLGDVYETGGGSLSCRKLYHVLVANYDRHKPKKSELLIKSVVSKCLVMADSANYGSIVFPAIATGGFNYPPQLVAKWMRREIMNFTGKNLKNVVIMLYPTNKAVIDAFNAEFNSTSPTGVPVSQLPGPVAKKPKQKPVDFQHKKIDDKSAKLGPLTVRVYQSDITSENSDVIVNSTNSMFDLFQGMVSKQILQKGGFEIQAEALSVSGEDYRVTSGGTLPCKNIVHLVTPKRAKELQTKLIKVLQEVEELRLSSISIPALGTGNLNLDPETVGAIMRDSIEKFITSSGDIEYLDTINVVIWEDVLLKPFKDSILNKHAKKGLLAKLWDFGKDNLPGWLTGSNSEEVKNTGSSLFNISLYSTSEEDINEAIKGISKETGKQITKQVIHDESIGQLTAWEKHQIAELETKWDVRITDKSDRYLKQLELVGLTQQVMEVQIAIQHILHELMRAENVVAYVKWQKMTNGSGKWQNYANRSALVLETAFQEYSKGKASNSGKIKVPEFSTGTVSYHTVDLVKWTDEASSKIRRCLNENADDLPPSWDTMNKGTSLTRIVLPNSSKEYQDVLTKFQSSGTFFSTIVSIERIQNVSLYKQFAAKKTEVSTKLINFGKPIEQQLFHGTDVDDLIISHGFDRSFCGKNATVYGKGVYFATTASYSNGYARPNASGQRRMFLADVITGEYCTGNQNMISPPNKPSSTMKNDLYDSVVDNQMNPSIYVIFKDASAYPAYLITYV